MENVVGIGYRSSAGSTINEVTNIDCNGEESCTDTRITDFEYLKANGDNILSGATIVASSSSYNGTIYV